MALKYSALSNIFGRNLKQCCFSPLSISKQSQRLFIYSTDQIKPEEQKGRLIQVYYGILTPQVKAVKFFSFSSSMVGIIGQPFLYEAVVSTKNVPVIIAAYSFIGFFTLVTPLLLHFITKKYVTHLFYKQATDSYVARTVSFLCTTKETEFKPDDVRVPDVPGMFTSFFVNKKALFIDPRLFENPHHYARIMGYDKPLDFKLSDPPKEDKSD